MWSLEDSSLLTVNRKNYLKFKGEGRVSLISHFLLPNKWFIHHLGCAKDLRKKLLESCQIVWITIFLILEIMIPHINFNDLRILRNKFEIYDDSNVEGEA